MESMKMNAKNILTLAAASIAALCACSKTQLSEPTALPTPEASITELTCTGFTLSWETITDAGSYTYSFNGGEEISQKETSVTFSGLQAATTYTVKLRADAGINGNYTSSQTVTYSVTTDGVSTLEAPQPELVANYMSKTIVKWSSVYGADAYEYRVGNFSGKTSSLSVEINGLEASTNYVFSIKATSTDKNVNDSEAAELKFTTLSASEDIPQVIMSVVETGADYCTFNVYAVADFRYLYFGVPTTYFSAMTETEIRDYYLSAFVKSITDAGYELSAGIQQYTYTGTASYTATPLYSETSYSIVAFGVNTDGVATSPLYRVETKTLADDAAPIPDITGASWFAQSLYLGTNGIYNPSNSMYFNWKGTGVKTVTSLMTSTRSFKLYFDSSADLFKAYVLSKGTKTSDATTIAKVNSEKGFSSRYSLSSSTSYTLGALAVNEAGDTTFVVNSLPTKSSASYYDWAGVSLGKSTSHPTSSSLTGVFQTAFYAEEEPLNFHLKGLRYYFCPVSELSGLTTDDAARIVEEKGTDLSEANIDLMNLTGSFSLSFGVDGTPLEAGTQYILLATFTERNGDTLTRYAIGKTSGTASSSSATKSALRSAPALARPELSGAGIIDTYIPLCGDEF